MKAIPKIKSEIYGEVVEALDTVRKERGSEAVRVLIMATGYRNVASVPPHKLYTLLNMAKKVTSIVDPEESLTLKMSEWETIIDYFDGLDFDDHELADAIKNLGDRFRDRKEQHEDDDC